METDHPSSEPKEIQKIFIKDELNLSAVALVHATKFKPQFDENGSIFLDPGLNSGRPLEKGFRNSLHFALNHHVGSHTLGNWDEAPFVVIGGFAAVHEKNKPQETGHYFEDALNAKTLMSFHPVDSWYNLGLYAKVEVPSAILVCPATETQNLPENALSSRQRNVVFYKTHNFSTTDMSLMMKDHGVGLINYLKGAKEDSLIYEGRSSAYADRTKFLDLGLPSLLDGLHKAPEGTSFENHLKNQGFQDDFVAVLLPELVYYSKLQATKKTLNDLGYPYLSANDTWDCVSIASKRKDSLEQTALHLGAKYGSLSHHNGTQEEMFEDIVNNALGSAAHFQLNILQGKSYAPEHVLHLAKYGKDNFEKLHAAFQSPELPLGDKFSAVKFIENTTGINILTVMPEQSWRDFDNVPWYENIATGKPHITDINLYKEVNPAGYEARRTKRVATVRAGLADAMKEEAEAFIADLYMKEDNSPVKFEKIREILRDSRDAWRFQLKQKRGQGVWQKNRLAAQRMNRRDFNELKTLMASEDMQSALALGRWGNMPPELGEKVEAKIDTTLQTIKTRQDARSKSKNAQKLGF